ncbi:MAG TPA: hypothetical protein VG755_38070 [Nannocystaceae bacterium]|nr:hypothetical protein [Nannocystaceae bacterium]
MSRSFVPTCWQYAMCRRTRDDDRLPATLDPSLEGTFRTPTLRCVAMRPSFFHTGQALGLPPVIDFFDRGGDPEGGYPGTKEIAPLGLSTQEKQDLVAFLRTLDGPGPAAELLAPPP